MNNTDSQSSTPVNPCLQWHLETPAFFLECVPLNGRVYGFPYSHLLNYRLEPNPDIEHAPDAPPERLGLWFSTHQVVILGWHLQSIRACIRHAQGFTVKALDSRYANLQPKECFVSDIAVLTAGE